ncbi:MAG: SDR family oxidoreductase [Actinomycetota bacterium]|jgi:NAD(P)-dependent dehydrogenase (short-subunit alcohol dehydrogenase family)
MKLDLTGQRALVTGGASGIGATVARRFASLGAHVIVTDLNDVDGAAVAAEVGGEYHHLDVSSAKAWHDLIDPLDALDIAFLNAGVSTRLPGSQFSDEPLSEVTDEAYGRIMGANVDGVVFGARAVLPKMLERGRGHIVMTASMAGLGAVQFDPIYALTKHAVVGFAKSLGAAAGPRGVCTSAICPGFADTNIVSTEARQMLGVMGVPIMSPERVADTVITALEANKPGSVWAVWGDLPITQYEPTPPFHGLIPPR